MIEEECRWRTVEQAERETKTYDEAWEYVVGCRRRKGFVLVWRQMFEYNQGLMNTLAIGFQAERLGHHGLFPKADSDVPVL